MANPWFQHFKQAQVNEKDRCLVVILSPDVTPDNRIIREQVIGEARAYDTCSKYPEETYNRLIKERQQKDETIL